MNPTFAMLKIVLGILAVAVLAVAGLLIYAATRPDTYIVERSTTVAAPPAEVYAILADFHQFPAWSPWQKLDPEMETTFSGAPTGTGAIYAWSGNDQAGSGRMEIVEATPPAHIVIRLEFLKPFESTARTEYFIAPEGTGSRVTWRMSGENAYMVKLITVFFDMNAAIGKDFDEGLANLKKLAES